MPPNSVISSSSEESESDVRAEEAPKPLKKKWYKRGAIGRLYFRIKNLQNRTLRFFLHLFVLIARVTRFLSKIIAYGSWYAVPWMLIFQDIGWLTFPTLSMSTIPLSHAGIVGVFGLTFFIIGLTFYAIASWLDNNIHRAMMVPYERDAMTAFASFMNQYKVDGEPYYPEAKTQFYDYVACQVQSGNTKAFYETLASFDTLRESVGRKIQQMNTCLGDVEKSDRSEIMAPRIKLLAYLLVCEKIKTNPALVISLCQNVLLHDLHRTQRLVGTEGLNITFWTGIFSKWLQEKSDKKDGSMAIKEIIETIPNLWLNFDNFYASIHRAPEEAFERLEHSMANIFHFRIKKTQLNHNGALHAQQAGSLLNNTSTRQRSASVVNSPQLRTSSPSFISVLAEDEEEQEVPKKRKKKHFLPAFFRFQKKGSSSDHLKLTRSISAEDLRTYHRHDFDQEVHLGEQEGYISAYPQLLLHF